MHPYQASTWPLRSHASHLPLYESILFRQSHLVAYVPQNGLEFRILLLPLPKKLGLQLYSMSCQSLWLWLFIVFRTHSPAHSSLALRLWQHSHSHLLFSPGAGHKVKEKTFWCALKQVIRPHCRDALPTARQGTCLPLETKDSEKNLDRPNPQVFRTLSNHFLKAIHVFIKSHIKYTSLFFSLRPTFFRQFHVTQNLYLIRLFSSVNLYQRSKMGRLYILLQCTKKVAVISISDRLVDLPFLKEKNHFHF